MTKLQLKNLERIAKNDLELFKELKDNYRKITPLEAFSLLGEKKKITRIVDSGFDGKYLQNIFIDHSEDYFGNLDFYLTRDGNALNSEKILEEILTQEWFVKL